MHYDEVLDLGYDYGALGGLAWDTTVIEYPNGQSRRNQNRSAARGAWQLGDRRVDGDTADTLDGFFHAMRGRTHSFLYLDWGDYLVTEQQLIVEGDEAQLIKIYGLAINPWVREIKKPDAESVVIEINEGAGWEALEAGVDYTLDATSGLVTFDEAPETSAQLRWSGRFYVPVRFDRDKLDKQFLGIEERSSGGVVRAYAIGGLAVIEEPL